MGKISEIPKSYEIQNFGFRKKLISCSHASPDLSKLSQKIKILSNDSILQSLMTRV
jgi:hypothetical protein